MNQQQKLCVAGCVFFAVVSVGLDFIIQGSSVVPFDTLMLSLPGGLLWNSRDRHRTNQ